ncbi:MAG: hypothetical protein Ta2G_14000 [Termitinemataceae bacterium]|nr:MAG: hypothetical protein Ta2G_14000 [Termitinemataceae bacterium]
MRIFSFLLCCIGLVRICDAQPELAWRQAMGGSSICRMQYLSETVASVCQGGLYVMFGKDGRPLWQYKAGGRLQPFFARDDVGISYLFRTNNTMQAVSRVGKLLWQKKIGDEIVWQPLLGYDSRIFLFSSKKITCINSHGVTLWQITTESPFAFSPRPDARGGFVCALKNGTLLSVDCFGNTKTIPLPRVPLATVSLDNNKKFLVIYPEGNLEIYDDANVKKGLPSLNGGVVTVSEYNNQVAFLLKSGELIIWQQDKGIVKKMQTTLPIIQNEEYVINFDSKGISVCCKNGAVQFDKWYNMLWKLDIKNAGQIPSIGGNQLFVSNNDWLLYAYKVSNDTSSAEKNERKSYGISTQSFAQLESFEYVFSGGNEEYLRLINNVFDDVTKGNVGTKEPYYTRMLMYMSKAENQFEKSGRAENFEGRLTAIRLLGKMGGIETMPFLAELFLLENNLTIKAATAEAITDIGMDYGVALSALESLQTNKTALQSERLLCASAKAITNICKFSDSSLTLKCITLLVKLKNASASHLVKKTVQTYLDDLFKSR